MRPIMLDMHGFAAFREPTRVDFTDADFFALVGPTGSGKSTVIDAMTFALYGSVPRWGRKDQVSLALAPTVDRGTVKLVFEIGRDRYVVARELRRGSGKSSDKVNQRAASLERLASPDGLAEPGEQTIPLAKDLAGVTEAVSRLLGLPYEDFIQCVVLPQGDFQKFLHAQPKDRQEILLRLLGAENYGQMGSRANERARAAEARAEIIRGQLHGYEDATDEALASARASEATLEALAESVAGAMPEITAVRSSLAAADDRLVSLRSDRNLLVSLAIPDDVAAVDSELARSRDALAELRSAEEEAEEKDGTARAALADGPKRAPLELARERRAERARIAASLPDLETSVSGLSEQAAKATEATEAAEHAVEQARERRDSAERAATAAGEQVARLGDEHAILSSVTVPDGVREADTSLADARDALAAADRELKAAETIEAEAAEARIAAGSQAPMQRLLGDLEQVREVLGNLSRDREAVASARVDQDRKDQAVAAAEEEQRRRREALEEAQQAHAVAGLRPHLSVGEPCPLCEQTVSALPEVPEETLAAGKAARAALNEAEKSLKQAQADAGTARTMTARAESTLESAVSRGNKLLASLAKTLAGPLAGAPLTAARALAETRLTPESPGHPGAADGAREEAAALLREAERVEREADHAVKAANAARTRHRKAQERLEKADADLDTARQTLRDARDPLVRFGAPPVDEATLARAWADLSSWAGKQAAERSAGLASARDTERQARMDHDARVGEFAAADRALATARKRARTAESSEQKARAELSQATARIGELDRLLGGEPDADEIARLLTELDRLEAGADAAQKELRRARAARASGEETAAAAERADRAARARLSAARDRVVSLGAPALDDENNLVGGWTALVTWARTQAESRERDMAQAAADADKARNGLASLTARLAESLSESGIAVDASAEDSGSVADQAPSLVAAACEKARFQVKRVQERQAEAAVLRAQQKKFEEDQQVAKLLGNLLRSNAFQRWLLDAALDDLVTHASVTLNELTGGQYDLAYDGGNFYVIDHADADTRRSVRTLSGGETFQASLALALALSSQISALSAAGAARLDSIFLDEGFGTLDPETLEVVATTLETLAQGDRMVGVVTHVGALAERVPVRFRVSRNARTSVVTREGLDIAMEELA